MVLIGGALPTKGSTYAELTDSHFLKKSTQKISTIKGLKSSF